MTTISQALKEGASRLVYSEDPQLEAGMLLAWVLNKNREYLYTWPEQELDAADELAFRSHCQRRIKGHPIAYLTGSRAFWDMELTVNSAVLIPRPETELLVELALNWLPESSCKVADLGTGSGAIALAIAKNRPQARVIATDVSNEALDVARENSQAMTIQNVEFAQGAWLAALPSQENSFNMIVSNPPYIDEHDHHLFEGDVAFEPALALVAAEHGLADLRTIIATAPAHLAKGGRVLLEHGYNQGEAVRELFKNNRYTNIETFQDLAGHDRVTAGIFT